MGQSSGEVEFYAAEFSKRPFTFQACPVVVQTRARDYPSPTATAARPVAAGFSLHDLQAFCGTSEKPSGASQLDHLRLASFSGVLNLSSGDANADAGSVGFGGVPLIWLAKNDLYVQANGNGKLHLELLCHACVASFNLSAFLKWLRNSQAQAEAARLSTPRLLVLLSIIASVMHEGQPEACRLRFRPRQQTDPMDLRGEALAPNGTCTRLPTQTQTQTQSQVQVPVQRTISKYSRSAKLMYFLSPHESTILIETPSEVRARQREARFTRNLREPNEREPYAHRTLAARYNSFFDDPAQPSTFFRWARSLNLAVLLAHLGFYLVPRSQQSNKNDKIRCTYCKRSKYGWYLWPYPETTQSAAARPSDLEIAIAVLKWHRIKSPTCPAILDLNVDDESETPANIIVPASCSSAQLASVSMCPLEEEEQPVELFNVSETNWQSHTNGSVQSTTPTSSYCNRIKALSISSPKFVELCSEDVRLFTFMRGSLVISEEKHIDGCLERTKLPLGNDRWPQSAPSAQRMAFAGFFATLRADEVLCHFCGGALTDWRNTDDPLAEHAFHFPSCPFILNTCGARFVGRVRARACRTQFSPVLGAVELGAIQRRVEARDVRCRPEVHLERTIAEELKCDHLLFSHAVETALRDDGDYKDALALLDVIQELEALRQQLKLDVCEFVRRRNEEYDQLLRGTHVLMNQNQNQATDQQQTATTCAVCLENPLQLAFVPCGHFSTCFACGSRLDTCPMCRKPIRGVVRVYL